MAGSASPGGWPGLHAPRTARLRAGLCRSGSEGSRNEQYGCGSGKFHTDIPGKIERLFKAGEMGMVRTGPRIVEAILQNGDLSRRKGVCLRGTSD
jgi:hypothetical protein